MFGRDKTKSAREEIRRDELEEAEKYERWRAEAIVAGDAEEASRWKAEAQDARARAQGDERNAAKNEWRRLRGLPPQ